MTGATQVTVEMLCEHLQRALRHGARAGCLLLHTPELVELLYPANKYLGLSLDDRAGLVEKLIRDGVESIGGEPGRALATVLCLAPGTLARMTLTARRRMVADWFGVQPRTWRSEYYEKRLLFYLASEMYHSHIAPADTN